jgi:hypothetical protein
MTDHLHVWRLVLRRRRERDERFTRFVFAIFIVLWLSVSVSAIKSPTRWMLWCLGGRLADWAAGRTRSMRARLT